MTAARGDALSAIVKRTVALADEFCACKDKECGAKIRAKITELRSMARASVSGGGDDDTPKPSEEQIKQASKANDKIDSCAEKLGVEVEGSSEANRMRKFANDMCRCKDGACATGVHKRFMTWVREYFKGGKRKGTKRAVEKWKKAQKKFSECYIAAMKAQKR